MPMPNPISAPPTPATTTPPPRERDTPRPSRAEARRRRRRRVRAFRGAGEGLSAIIAPGRCGGPAEGAHGGIVAAYPDEVLAGPAVCHTGRPPWTGELSVRYVNPTPVERPLLGRARA